ncbi:MAG: hypothetical protein JWR01_1137, partial [Subtercola sp.]|nr:hypothetical protein [Subtercola sp.]
MRGRVPVPLSVQVLQVLLQVLPALTAAP